MPEFGDVFDEIVDVVDRLIVDSTEWPDEHLAHGYRELAQRFDRTVDLGHRLGTDGALAARARRRVAVRSARDLGDGDARAGAAARRLAALAARATRSPSSTSPRTILTSVYVDGKAIDAPPGEPPPPSELLSDQLERFTRDPVYEAAVRAAAE